MNWTPLHVDTALIELSQLIFSPQGARKVPLYPELRNMCGLCACKKAAIVPLSVSKLLD